MDAADVVAASSLLMEEAPSSFTSRQLSGVLALPVGRSVHWVHPGSQRLLQQGPGAEHDIVSCMAGPRSVLLLLPGVSARKDVVSSNTLARSSALLWPPCLGERGFLCGRSLSASNIYLWALMSHCLPLGSRYWCSCPAQPSSVPPHHDTVSLQGSSSRARRIHALSGKSAAPRTVPAGPAAARSAVCSPASTRRMRRRKRRSRLLPAFMSYLRSSLSRSSAVWRPKRTDLCCPSFVRSGA